MEASLNEQTSDVNFGTRNVEMARSSEEEETKDLVREPVEDLAAKMAGLDIQDGPDAKKKKPRKKPKAAEKNENSISNRTRSRIAEFVKANP